MKIKYYLLIALTLLLLSSCSSTRKLLVKKDDYLGWQMTNYELYSSKKEFERTLNENYHLYSGYGLTMIIYQEIEGPNFMKMRIEIYKTKDRPGAQGLYKRYQSFTQIPFGKDGSESPGFIAFRRDNYFVKIIAVRNLQDKNNYLKNVAQIIDSKITR
ncbi:MAG: hypothetical protein L6422_09595 [Candidatus Marinimicrobia bacterium]|nr:hypothetical protein [Candidatus Neomarinimicrobiota bacterium]